MTICSGKLNKKIDIIQKSSAVRGEGGVFTEGWTLEESVWANLTPKKKNPLLEGLTKEAQTTHTITIRKNDNLDVGKRLRYGTRFFFIQSWIDVEEKGKYTSIEAIESSKATVTVS